MKHVVVTGGAGYVGSHACKRLSQAGYLPIVLDDLSRGHREAVKWGPLEVGDVCDTRWVETMLRYYEPVAVLHFAALAYVGESWENPAAYYRNNVGGTLSVLEAMVRAEIKNLVFSSSCAAAGFDEEQPDPISPYGRSKFHCEVMIQDFESAYGLRAIMLRYFNAAGADPDGEIGECHVPETHLIPLVLSAATGGPGVVINGAGILGRRDGTCVRDYVHVADLAEAHLLALEKLCKPEFRGHNPIEMGSGRGYSVLEIIQAAERICGCAIPYSVGPFRKGDARFLVSATGTAKYALGWDPKFSDIDTILTTAWKWHLKRNGHAPQN